MTGDAVVVVGGDTVSPGEYRALLAAVEWRTPEQPDEVIQQALATTWNVTARDANGELLGLARVLDDGLLYASVWDVIVHPDRQRQGIGRALLARVMEHTKDRRLVSLVATEAGIGLYQAAGFRERDERGRGMFMRTQPPDGSGR